MARGIGLVAAGALAGDSAGAAAATKAAGLVSRGIAARMSAPYGGRLTATAGGAALRGMGGPAGFAIRGAIGRGVDYLVTERVALVGRDHPARSQGPGLALFYTSEWQQSANKSQSSRASERQVDTGQRTFR